METTQAMTKKLADPAFFLRQEFTDLLSDLRINSPVQWCQCWPDRGFWAVTRYQDIKRVVEQPMLFSNEAAGNIIPADPNLHRDYREEMGFGSLMTNTDPPKHTEIRRVFNRYFSGPRIAKLEGFCQEIVDEILSEVRGRKTFDFVFDAAAKLPARIICLLLGVPRQDWPAMNKYANSFASFADPELQLGETPGETFKIAMEFTSDYIRRLTVQRRLEPQDDLVSMAIGSEVNGEPISTRDAAWNSWAVLAAGFETSRNAISGGLLALMEHPEQARLLKENPALWPAAVDEIIRWTVPATALLRAASENTEIAGQPIEAGEWVVLFLESANRDASVFPDPFKFDITRRPGLQLGFGFGIHGCLGRMLAGLEIKVMLRTMLEQCESIALDGPLERVASTIAKGVKRMPVRICWAN